MDLTRYIPELLNGFAPLESSEAPWQITAALPGRIERLFATLETGYTIHGGVAIHRTATVEGGAIIKAPAIVGPHCFVAAHAYLRNGVLLMERVVVGPGCELKQSLIGPGTALAHFNFVGDSIVGAGVNFEAGSLIANHWNEREEKAIVVLDEGREIATDCQKFGALVGDGCKVGANAVLSPGTLLRPSAIVPRLALIDQLTRS